MKRKIIYLIEEKAIFSDIALSGALIMLISLLFALVILTFYHGGGITWYWVLIHIGIILGALIMAISAILDVIYDIYTKLK